MKYELVFLDWYKTLSDSLFWQEWSQNGDRQKDLSLIQEFMFAAGNTFTNDWMRGKYTTEVATTIISGATRLDKRRILDGLIESSKTMSFSDNNIVEQIRRIRDAGIKVIIATDNMDTFARWTVPALELDLMFDGIIDSHTQKALKSDFNGSKNHFFDAFLSECSIEPPRMVLIDDQDDARIVERTGIGFHYYDGSKTLSETLAEVLDLG